ncbi:hypothetical protein LTR91_003951 [Friedmanniomyces endolithicus]|uniref:F-box domain-containing protein n=1 Tax=Friedmanniomyces endolithicus TaxID=329885 RepID=A0A4U0V1G0_9PEZI|nr:hypothetical protein LTS09_008354 [Friedmanniomyces endolithicus]KAK0276613.1 hypothetical protein LTR35_010477 [Friedmanniomyces endolithicus]KAK0294149.1 hypothetical protein LTS00_007123 [Friedmanniomyces endolithicus]KAK0303396.1 hypothetical protein LTR01_008124 [Friedmanniomyces endolithicus]KAK0315102.1 hypothetical protein LTR82_012660 [Friedmanniomyces endolithicus]
MSNIQSSSTKPTGFSNLPAELRNQIYSLALHDSPPIRITNSTNDITDLALLQASPQICSEAGPMRWSRSTFHFDLTTQDILLNAPFASRWLSAFGTHRIRYVKELTISHADRFSVTLGHEMMANHKPALVLKKLTMASADDAGNLPGSVSRPLNLAEVRASISSALTAMYADADLDLASYTEHNLVSGLAQFLHFVDRPFAASLDQNYESALQFITGGTRFYEMWLGGKFFCHDIESEVRTEEVRVAWESSTLPVDPDPVTLRDVRVVGSTEKWHGCAPMKGQWWTE